MYIVEQWVCRNRFFPTMKHIQQITYKLVLSSLDQFEAVYWKPCLAFFVKDECDLSRDFPGKTCQEGQIKSSWYMRGGRIVTCWVCWLFLCQGEPLPSHPLKSLLSDPNHVLNCSENDHAITQKVFNCLFFISFSIWQETNCLIWDETHGLPFQAHTL